MNKKEVVINDSKFILSYFSDDSQVKYIDNLNVYRTIVVAYQPTYETEPQALDRIRSAETSLLREVENLIEENQDFYSHFDYNFDYGFVGRTTHLGRDNGREIVISMELTIDIKLKKGAN